MDAGVLNFIGSLLGGVGEAKKAKQKQEEAKPMQEIQKQLLKLKLEEAKGKSKMMDMAQQYFTQQQTEKASKNLAEPVKPEKYETQFGDSFDLGTPEGSEQINKGSELLNAIVGGQGGGQGAGGQIPPKMAALLKSQTGIDFLGAGRLQEQISNNQRLKSQGRERIDISRENLKRGYGEGKYVEVKNQDGSISYKKLPKYGGFGGLDSFKKTPAIKSMPISEANLPLWVNEKTLASPKFGTTPSQAQKSGFKRVAAADKTKINDLKGLSVLVDKIESLMEGAIPKEETASGRLVGAPERKLKIMFQTDNQLTQLNKLLSGTQAALVRMYEKGTLTDKDIARATKLNINISDKGSLSWEHIKGLRGFIKDTQKSFISGLGTEKVDFKFNPKTGKLEPVT